MPEREGGVAHVEGRFSALETKVSGLQAGFVTLEHQVEEGFKAVFTKIDGISTSRSAATLPWIAMFLVVLGLAAKVVYSDLSFQGEAIRDVKMLAAQDLKDINARLYVSQYDRGVSDAHQAATVEKLKELDVKLQNETKLVADRIDERIKALDEKLQTESRLMSQTNKNQIDTQVDYAAEMRAWRLQHVKEDAQLNGEQDARLSDALGQLKTVEERQYTNTNGIGELKGQRKQ